MTTRNTPAYDTLTQHFGKIKDLNNALAILSKDMEVFMPSGSEADRVRQLTTLAEMADTLIKEPDVEEWLNVAEQTELDLLSTTEKRNLQLMRKEWVRSNTIPTELVRALTEFDSEGGSRHTKVRQEKNGDWDTMKDWYAKGFELSRQKGEILKEKLGFKTAYAALMDGFSPELTEETVEREFAVLEKELPALIKAATEKQNNEAPPIPLKGPFPKEAQTKLLQNLVKAMGFDTSKGRLDVIDGHPSCGGSASDIRFTTDYNEDDFIGPVYSTIHETGHALYDQNTPLEWRYAPVGEHMGMAVHESQSRIMEVQACHTPEFFEFLEKATREAFNRPDDPALDAQNLEKLINQVNPSFIRIEADEMTYPAHIILRHKLEKAMVEGAISIDELPQKWNEGMEQLLGITPPTNFYGCMQDVHWPCGYAGYFPAYTIGDMIAAQLFQAAKKAKPEIRSELSKGDFTSLREWLTENIHSKGCMLTTDELLIQATGEPLNAKYYLNHLSERYVGKPFEAGLGSTFKNKSSKLGL